MSGKQKIKKFFEKIEKANRRMVQNHVNSILKLKNITMSSVKAESVHKVIFQIHNNTHGRGETQDDIIKFLRQLEDKYQFLSLHYLVKDIPVEKKSVFNTSTITIKKNFVSLKVDWGIYIQESMVEDPQTESYQLPDTTLEQDFVTINIQNVKLLKDKINKIFSNARKHASSDITVHELRLIEKTMFHIGTRQHYRFMSRAWTNKYPGILDIHEEDNTSDVIYITIYWNLYLKRLNKNQIIKSQSQSISNK